LSYLHALSRVHQLRLRPERREPMRQKDLVSGSCLVPHRHYSVTNLSEAAQVQLSRPLSLSTIQLLERDEHAGSLDQIMNLKLGNLLKLCQGLGCKPGDIWERLR